MLLSCKISNAILTHIERLGGDLDLLEDLTDLPREFLRDPTYWVESQRLERLLDSLSQAYGHLSQEPLLRAAGRQTPHLRAWGVLDSVLKMLPAPQDLWAQPDRFFSYFISPPPPVGDIRKSEQGIEFDLPISTSEIQFTAEYLLGAFEALPLYAGEMEQTCTWNQNHFGIQWSKSQPKLLPEGENETRQLNPTLVNNVLNELEEKQHKVDELTRALKLKEKELEALKRAKAVGAPEVVLEELKTGFMALQHQANDRVHDVLNDVFRLNDYLVRSQQIITLLIGQGRRDPQVKEAMRRVDYEILSKEFPHLIKSSVQSIQSLQTELKGFFDHVKNKQPASSSAAESQLSLDAVQKD